MPWTPDPLRNTIPGVTGKSIPGSARLPSFAGESFRTNVGHLSSSSEFREYHRQQVRDTEGKFAGGWGFAWQGLAAIDTKIYEHQDKIIGGLEQGMQDLAAEMLAWAKDNASWVDFPGDPERPNRPTESARENLQAVVVKDSNTQFSIFIGHGRNVYYGIWLEVRHGGKFSIILPTVFQFGPQLGERVLAQTR